MTLKVSEIFGPTFQGEGPFAGTHCVFIRLANCNQTCRWCDTPYTWAFTENKARKHDTHTIYHKETEVTELSVEDVIEGVRACYPQASTLVISGGEPLLQVKGLYELARALDRTNTFKLHIETAGTLSPGALGPRIDAFVVSPKLDNSGNPLFVRYRPSILKEFTSYYRSRSWFKFVVASVSNFPEIDAIVRECNIPVSQVYIMPEGTRAKDILEGAQDLWNTILERGYNLSLRTHVLVKGDKRGYR